MCEGYECRGGDVDEAEDEAEGGQGGVCVREECEGATRDVNDVAMRDGIRSAKAMRGYGSIAIDVNDESVAP